MCLFRIRIRPPLHATKALFGMTRSVVCRSSRCSEPSTPAALCQKVPVVRTPLQIHAFPSPMGRIVGTPPWNFGPAFLTQLVARICGVLPAATEFVWLLSLLGPDSVKISRELVRNRSNEDRWKSLSEANAEQCRG